MASQPERRRFGIVLRTQRIADRSRRLPPRRHGAATQRAASASVFVTSQDAQGEAITRGFGFFIDKNFVLTSFQVVDGATSVRIDLADGTHTVVTVARSRPNDWAILRLTTIRPLEKAAPDSWKVGDLCYAPGNAAARFKA